MTVPAKRLDCVFIDYDGVIAKNIVSIVLKATHKFMAEHMPTPFEVLRDGLKSSVGMPAQQSVEFLFNSLGIEEKIPAYYHAMQNMEKYTGEKVVVEEDFYSFIDLCREKGIAYKIFSLTDRSQKHVSEVLARIGEDAFFDLKGRSKQNIKTYGEVARELDLDLANCLIIDDAAPVLRAAKMNGVGTVMMLNDLFTREDADLWRDYVDHAVTSFHEAERLLP